jgi:hypothetical protein
MRRATITLPEDLDAELSAYLAGRDAPPSLTAVVQAALRRYLAEARLAERTYRPPQEPFAITPARRGSGRSDVSAEHDRYLAEDR